MIAIAVVVIIEAVIGEAKVRRRERREGGKRTGGCAGVGGRIGGRTAVLATTPLCPRIFWYGSRREQIQRFRAMTSSSRCCIKGDMERVLLVLDMRGGHVGQRGAPQNWNERDVKSQNSFNQTRGHIKGRRDIGESQVLSAGNEVGTGGQSEQW